MDDLTPQEGVIETALTMDFPSAIREIKNGKKVRRITWPEEDYGVFEDGWLKVFTDKKLSRWLINEGDMNAEDWIVIKEIN